MANYPILITALREISGGTGSFKPHVQAEAEQLHDIFLNRKLMMQLHLYWDVTEQLSFQSKDLQYRVVQKNYVEFELPSLLTPKLIPLANA